jgi:hypothetical protein
LLCMVRQGLSAEHMDPLPLSRRSSNLLGLEWLGVLHEKQLRLAPRSTNASCPIFHFRNRNILQNTVD